MKNIIASNYDFKYIYILGFYKDSYKNVGKPSDSERANSFPSNAEIPTGKMSEFNSAENICKKLFHFLTNFFHSMFLYHDYKFLRFDVLIQVHTKTLKGEKMTVCLRITIKAFLFIKQTVYYDGHKKIPITNY